jgi:vitamin K-dependent gamma-carboxylase
MEWVPSFSETGYHILIGLMVITSLGIMLGLFLRFCAILFGLSLALIFLQDNTLFNNHFYFFFLLVMALAITKPDYIFTIKDKFGRAYNGKFVPIWHYYYFQFLVFIAYFFAGVAKVSEEWLNLSFTSLVVRDISDSFLYKLLGQDLLTYLVTYGGMLFDLLIGFILLHPKSRMFGVLLVVIFNITNSTVLFDDIGLFPFFMIACTVVFFRPDLFSFLLNKPAAKARKKERKSTTVNTELDKATWTGRQKLIAGFLALFFVIQIIPPIRSKMLDKLPEWYGVGGKFAWRMKMHSRKVDKVDIYLQERGSNNRVLVELNTYLNTNQIKNFTIDPRNLATLGKYFQNLAEEELNISNIAVFADIEISFNGSPPQKLIDPNLDITTLELSTQDVSWVNPLKN